MKTYRSFLVFVSLLSLGTTCRRDLDITPTSLELNATIKSLQTIDCQIPLLDFGKQSNIQQAIAQMIGGGTNTGLYYAVHLDKQFLAEDTLNLTIRKCTPNEIPVCTTLGPSYQAIAVVSATKLKK